MLLKKNRITLGLIKFSSVTQYQSFHDCETNDLIREVLYYRQATIDVK